MTLRWLPFVLMFGCGDDGATTQSTTSSGSSSTGTGGTGQGASGGGGSGANGGNGAGGAVGGGAAGGSGGGLVGCLTCTAPTDAGQVANVAILEASGITASAIHPNVFYVNNDSGDSARFFAVGADGSDQGTFDVGNATAVDWEDIGRGPCSDASKSCIYLADIGDNAMARNNYVVYRVQEPQAIGAGPHAVTAEALRFSYPDGPHNAEALLVHPEAGLFILTKTMSTPEIFSFPLPLDPNATVTLVKVGDLNLPDIMGLVTGASFRPQGNAVLVRTYASLWQYPIPNGTPLQTALAAAPCQVPVFGEGQGEAVGWTSDGNGYVTVSEGNAQHLHASTCR